MDDNAQSDGIARWELAVNRIAELEAKNERLKNYIRENSRYVKMLKARENYAFEELSELRNKWARFYDQHRWVRKDYPFSNASKYSKCFEELNTILSADKGDG